MQQRDIAQAGDVAIQLQNGDVVLVADAAERSLQRHRTLSQDLQGAGSALHGTPRTTEVFTETEDTVLLQATTTFTVDDPTALRNQAPALATYQAKTGGAGSFHLSEFNTAQRTEFESFRNRMLKQPADHPLGAAARQSSSALLDAVLDGQGDITVTTSVRIPKGGIARQGRQIQAPSMNNGSFDFSNTFTKDAHLSAIATDTATLIPNPPPNPSESGEDTTIGQYLNGFLEDDAFEWVERWDFPSGFFRIRAGAYYAFGLRIPIKVTGTMTPTQIVQSARADRDADSTFATTIEAKVFDAGENFYANAGVPSNELYEAKELVIEAGAYVNLRLSAGWGLIDINETIPNNLDFDFGQDFQPPFGDCGTNCGFDVWVPSDVTHTGFNVLGIVKGEARVGFNVSGDGEAAMTYESLYDGQVVPSRRGSNSEQNSHRLTFSKQGTRNFETDLEALEAPGKKSFGYRISDVDYTWDVEVTPGIRGDVEVDASPFFDLEYGLGPLWLDFATIPLGELQLGTLEGTRTSHEVSSGSKEWHEITVAGTLPVDRDPKTAIR